MEPLIGLGGAINKDNKTQGQNCGPERSYRNPLSAKVSSLMSMEAVHDIICDTDRAVGTLNSQVKGGCEGTKRGVVLQHPSYYLI